MTGGKTSLAAFDCAVASTPGYSSHSLLLFNASARQSFYDAEAAVDAVKHATYVSIIAGGGQQRKRQEKAQKKQSTFCLKTVNLESSDL